MPALQDGNFVLTQNVAILGYIADCFPNARLAGDGSARERAEVSRWLSFVGADVHPAFLPLFHPARFIEDEARHGALGDAARHRLRPMFEYANTRREGPEGLAGLRSIADPYFYVTLRCAMRTGVDLSGLEAVAVFRSCMDADPGVRAALATERPQ